MVFGLVRMVFLVNICSPPIDIFANRALFPMVFQRLSDMKNNVPCHDQFNIFGPIL